MAGGVLLPILLALQFKAGGFGQPVLVAEASLALGLVSLGELLERFLFFVTVQPVKMPGSIVA